MIEAELTRRLEAAQTAHPAKRHQDRIVSELVQLQRRAERLLTAYQEELLDLDELRRRMPALRQRETRLKSELESLRSQLADQSACLRLAHTLNEFLERLRTQAQNLDVLARQRIVRLIVKEIVVDNDSIAIRALHTEFASQFRWTYSRYRARNDRTRKRRDDKFAFVYVA